MVKELIMNTEVYSHNKIPQVFHYTWFSDDGTEMPDRYSKFVDSWKHFHPDAEFVLWDRDRILNEPELMDDLKEIGSCIRVDDDGFIEKNKTEDAGYTHACLSDYVRYYALEKYGGVYFDIDMDCRRNQYENIDKIPEDIGFGICMEYGYTDCSRLGNRRINNNFICSSPNNKISREIRTKSKERLKDIFSAEDATQVFFYKDIMTPCLTTLRDVAWWIGPRWIDHEVIEKNTDNVFLFHPWEYNPRRIGDIETTPASFYPDYVWAVHHWNNSKTRTIKKWKWLF
jgi:hypothetical protein